MSASALAGLVFNLLGFLASKKGKEKETALKFLYICLDRGIGSFCGRRKSGSLHKTDQLKEVLHMSSMNCTVA